MSAKPRKNAPPAASKRNEDRPVAAPAPTPAAPSTIPAASIAEPAPFHERHPKIANALFAAVCVYVAMLCLLALDQTFHWGIFGPKVPPTP